MKAIKHPSLKKTRGIRGNKQHTRHGLRTKRIRKNQKSHKKGYQKRHNSNKHGLEKGRGLLRRWADGRRRKKHAKLRSHAEQQREYKRWLRRWHEERRWSPTQRTHPFFIP